MPDFTLPDQLPTDPSALIALMREQQATIAAIRAKAQDHIDYLDEQILLARRRMFGPSYRWVQTGGPPDKPVVIDDYNRSRSGEIPMNLAAGFQGFLMTDGDEGYNALARSQGVQHPVCWAHCRRGFIEARRIQPKGKTGRADEAIRQIRTLYRIERERKNASVTERLFGRRNRSVRF